MSSYNYKIIETSDGPQISHSTKSIYDVILSQEAGDDLFAICLIHGLNSAQVHLAQDYIEEHEAALQIDSMIRQQKKLERLNALRAIAHERARVELEVSPQRQDYEKMLREHEQLHHDEDYIYQPTTHKITDYAIRETDAGPMISHSRISVYDVMESQQKDHDFFTLCVIYELRPIQVQIALDYIAENHLVLETELRNILTKKAEQRAKYEAMAAEWAKTPAKMTPQRQAFYALREKNRLQRGEDCVTSHS